ncbi:MAG: TRAP transporter small permease [Burkholderiaceae bacterium]|nr:TRAP transporter small permease [Burkholderiaceae bacterium]
MSASGPKDPAAPPAAGAQTRRRTRFEEAVAVLALAALVLLTLINVVVRYLTDQSFAETEEISIFLMVVLTMAGAAAAASRDRHLRIEYFLETGSAARRRRLSLLSAYGTSLFFVFMTVLLGRFAWDEYHFGETTMALGLPRWWYSVWLPVLSAGIAWRAFRLARRLAHGEPP